MVSIFDFIRNATGLCYFFIFNLNDQNRCNNHEQFDPVTLISLRFFSARPPPSSNKNFKWMVAIKKSLGNFCLHHFTHMVTASRIGAMHTAQPRLLTLGDHMHNCNILMHIRMPLTALALCLHHLPFILCSIHRIDRIANIIRHSYIEWVFCLRFE